MDYRRRAAELISSYLSLSVDIIYEFVEVRHKSEVGDLSFPCFKLCKLIDINPASMAEELRMNIQGIEFERIENIGPYLNFFIDKNLYVQEITNNILCSKNEDKGYNITQKNICIEFLSSKRKSGFSIDEFFSIILSNALSSIFKGRGYNVSVKEYMISEKQGYELIYKYINKSHIKVINNYSNKASEIIKELEEKNILCNEEMVKFISLEEYNMAPYVLWKADYGITDSMRILTSILNIDDKNDSNKNIFISDSLNTYKFKQLSKVMELLGNKKIDKFIYAEYGNIKIESNGILNGSTATVSVFNILLVIVNFVKTNKKVTDEVILKKSINILIFSMLMNFRTKNVIIDMNDFRASSDRNLYYVENICSVSEIIIRSMKRKINRAKFSLTAEERLNFTQKLKNFNNIIEISLNRLETAYISYYILELAHDIEVLFISRYVEEDKLLELEYIDLDILKAGIKVIKNALNLLGIELEEELSEK